MISDLLVYQLPTNANVMDELRITREVDGKPVEKGEKQAIGLFEKLEKSPTGEQERVRLRERKI